MTISRWRDLSTDATIPHRTSCFLHPLGRMQEVMNDKSRKATFGCSISMFFINLVLNCQCVIEQLIPRLGCTSLHEMYLLRKSMSIPHQILSSKSVASAVIHQNVLKMELLIHVCDVQMDRMAKVWTIHLRRRTKNDNISLRTSCRSTKF
jgi:hypothetical protein